MNNLNPAKADIRLMSFKELRHLQKVASESMVGPGAYDLPMDKPKDISFGRRTFSIPKESPGPGTYDSNANMLLKTNYSTRTFRI